MPSFRIIILFFDVIVASLTFIWASMIPSSGSVVDLGYAQYQGVFNASEGVTTFLSIRYADPPTGQFRFQAPQPPSTVEGVQIADMQPPECPQGSMGGAATTSFSKRQSALTEDCLFLNVVVPGYVNPDAKLPVVFWIHGGGYEIWSSSGFSGADLVNDAQGGAIAVVIQYRLGAFGFLAGSEVKNNGALNAGLLDQNFALQWVQKHIATFGGDPSKVTIWGQSAGAGSVLQHVVANGGNTQPPLFRAAMTSSAFLPSQYSYNDSIPEQVYGDIVQQSGCSGLKNTFKCLQNVDVNILNEANMNVAAGVFYGTFANVPVVDGAFIVERPSQTLQKGHVNGEVLLSVTNTFEGTIFVNASDSASGPLSDYVEQLFPTLAARQVSAVVKQYANIGLDDTFNQAVGIMGEAIFICPTYRLLAAFPGRSYKGEFAVPPGEHAQDLPYYFFNYPETRNFENPSFITSFSQPFLAVVKSLDPNDTSDPENITPYWTEYIPDNTEMLFNETTAEQPDIRPIHTDAGLIERCNFWESLAPFIAQ